MSGLLPLTPAPHPDESPKSYLTRLSEVNGYQGSRVISSLVNGSGEYVITSGWDYGRIRRLVGEQCDVPMDFGYRVSGKKCREAGRLLGHEIHVRHLGLQKARICPDCLAMLRYVPAKWDLKAYVACPYHGCMMLKHCAECGRRILHERPGVAVCQCGANFCDMTTAPAPPELLALCEILEALATGDSRALIHAPYLGFPVEDLLKMDLKVFLRVVVRLASLNRKLIHDGVWPMSSSEIAEMLSSVGKMFCDWPRNFHVLCAKWHSSLDIRPSRGGSFQGAFGWLFIQLHKNLKETRDQTVFLLREALVYGIQRWTRSVITIKESELRALKLPPKRYVNAHEAANWLGWKQFTVLRWLRSGRIPARQLIGKSMRPGWQIDLRDLEKLKVSKYPSLGIRAAARYLGVSVSLCKELRDRKLIPSEYQSEFQKSAAREDLDTFSDQISSKALPRKRRRGLVHLSRVLASQADSGSKLELLSRLRSGEVPCFQGPGKGLHGLLVDENVIALRIPLMPATHSGPSRPPIPVHAGRGGEAVWILSR